MTMVRPVFRKWLRILLPPIVLVLGVILWGDVEARRFQRLVAEVERRVPSPAPVSGEDGTRFYAAAAVLTDVPTAFPVVQTANAMRDALARARDIEPALQQAIADTLRVNEPALEAVDRAAGMRLGQVRWPFQVLRSVPVWSTVTPVMSLRTLQYMAAGDCDGSVRSLVSALRFLRGASADTQAYAATQQANVVRGLIADVSVMLQRCPLSGPALMAIDRALGDLFQPGDLQRLILGQAQFRYSNASVYVADGLYGDLIRPMRYRVASGIAGSTLEALDVADKPWPDRARGMTSLRSWKAWLAPRPLRLITGEANRSLFQFLAESFAAGVASVNAGRTALAIERYRREHGRFPNALSQIDTTREASLDPFSGSALVFRQRDGAYVLYSVGRDGKDDGGDVGPPTKGAVPGALGKDVGIIVVPPAATSSPPR